MKVRAVQKGFYGGQIRNPDKPDNNNLEFELKTPAHFSKRWMEPADEKSKSELEKYREDQKKKEQGTQAQPAGQGKS